MDQDDAPAVPGGDLGAAAESIARIIGNPATAGDGPAQADTDARRPGGAKAASQGRHDTGDAADADRAGDAGDDGTRDEGAEAPEGADATADRKSGGGEGHDVEADTGTPASEPPPFWPAQLREKWSALPPDVQALLTEHETARVRETNQRLEAAAAERKAAVDKATADLRKALDNETQRHAQALSAIAPELIRDYEQAKAEFERKYANGVPNPGDDPEAYQQYAWERDVLAQKQARVEAWAREWRSNQEAMERRASEQLAAQREHTYQVLARAFPREFGEADAALKSYREIGEYLMNPRTFADIGEAPFAPDVVQTVDRDPKLVLLARKAMLYDRLQARAAAAVQQARQQPAKPAQPDQQVKDEGQKPARKPAGRVQQPGTRRPEPGARESFVAARNKARQTGRVEDAAEAIRHLV